LTNKLSFNYFNTQEDIRPLFEKQLEACGVDYFDFYLMHAQSKARMPHYHQTRAYETVMELKQEGKIRHMGISFHDKAEALDEILTEHPEIEIVQIQFNYVDYEDEKVESRKCYEVCRKHNKPVIVMEPVKGGSLVNLPDAAQNVLKQLHGGSNASYAIRFAAGFDGIKMVLSGMSDIQQVEDNVGFMREFKPLNRTEREAVDKVSAIIRSQGTVPCTGCRYCTEVCPQEIPIPEIFAALNSKRQAQTTDISISDWACIKCGKCEDICPQKLNIREILTAAEAELCL
jgi:predicted aldo/keto reductase-like oxidoreductase